jgi:hypothetical protein
MHQVKPVFERLLGQLELALLGGMEDVADVRQENEWTTADCPAMVRLFVNKQRGFARLVMDPASHDEAVGSLMTLQWAWERRKTKHDTEDRSLHEVGQMGFNTIRNVIGDKMEETGWTRKPRNSGRQSLHNASCWTS